MRGRNTHLLIIIWLGFLDPFFFFIIPFLALDMHFMGAILRCSMALSITTLNESLVSSSTPARQDHKSDRDENLCAQLTPLTTT